MKLPMYYRLLLILFTLVLCRPSMGRAQEKTDHPTIQQLDAQLASGALNRLEYLDAVKAWVAGEFASGVQYAQDSLVRHLANYRRLAWEVDSLPGYRINYYIDLSNNAVYAGRDGEGIYFLENAEQQVVQEYGEKPLMVAGSTCNIYLSNGNYKKTIAAYLQERDYIKQFPELLRKEAIQLNIAASFINVLNPTVQAYAVLGDTTGVKETITLSEAIYKELIRHKRWKPKSATAFTVGFYMKNLNYHQYFTLYKDRQKSREALLGMEQALQADTTQPQSLINRLKPDLTPKLVDYFLTYGANDSAAYYLDKLKHSPDVYTDHSYRMNLYEARLLANRGNYRQAFERAMAASGDVDSLQSVLVNEIDELLYARSEAEFNREALQLAEQQKNRRTLWLIGVSITAILTMTIIYLFIRRRNRQTKLQLDKLNQAANIQVAAMEEVRTQAVREEQKRLSRDLHDGLSGTIAAAKLQLELLASDSVPEVTQKVQEIQGQLEHAYAIARGKSHAWYAAARGEERDFETRIRQVLDSALTDSQYSKEVQVDADSLSAVPFSVRIDLLRIVQEAVTNIIKHTKASHISVLLYREDGALVLMVSDDGAGTKSKNTGNGLGMRSMRDRTEQYGGTLKVKSDAAGFRVTVSIPLK